MHLEEPAGLRLHWKSILENAMETYQAGMIHRDSVGAQTSHSIETNAIGCVSRFSATGRSRHYPARDCSFFRSRGPATMPARVPISW